MALHYNLSKVYKISSNDEQFVLQTIALFLAETPIEIKNIKNGIKEKNYLKTRIAAQKLQPKLDLLGMDMAFDEVNQIIEWTKVGGKKKDIKEVFKLLKEQIELSSKEIKKNHLL